MYYASITQFLFSIKENCLFLARHGQTDWNGLGLLQGQQDRPLNNLGYVQRKNLFFRLKDVPISHIFTSSLQRAIQTATPISEEKELKIEKIEALNEGKLGVFEGENKFSFSDSYSKKIYTDFLSDEINVVLPGGGENLRMINKRIQKPLKRIINTVKKTNTLLIAHRNVNKMIIKSLLNLTFDYGYRVEHQNDWLYIFYPNSTRLFLAKINSPIGKIEITSGYETIG